MKARDDKTPLSGLMLALPLPIVTAVFVVTLTLSLLLFLPTEPKNDSSFVDRLPLLLKKLSSSPSSPVIWNIEALAEFARPKLARSQYRQ